MTLHRRGKPYTEKHARRELAKVIEALNAARAIEPGSDWRKRAGKAQTLQRLEAQERKWRNVLAPPPVERLFELPF